MMLFDVNRCTVGTNIRGEKTETRTTGNTPVDMGLLRGETMSCEPLANTNRCLNKDPTSTAAVNV